jgi:hypothetical protein
MINHYPSLPLMLMLLLLLMSTSIILSSLTPREE